MAPLVTLLTSALCIWLAQMAYWLPLKRRENYRLRFLLDFVATVPFAQVITWANSGRTSAPMLLVIYGGFFLWVSISTKLCTPAGRRCQRLLQRLDRAYVGIYL